MKINMNEGLNARGGHFVFNTLERMLIMNTKFEVLMPEVGILFLIPFGKRGLSLVVISLNARGGHFVFNTLILPHFLDFLSVDCDQEDKKKFTIALSDCMSRGIFCVPPFFLDSIISYFLGRVRNLYNHQTRRSNHFPLPENCHFLAALFADRINTDTIFIRID